MTHGLERKEKDSMMIRGCRSWSAAVNHTTATLVYGPTDGRTGSNK